MDRTPLVHIFAAVASAFLVTLLMAPTASAAAAPPGALFHSDFSDYDADWRSLPHVNAPSVTSVGDQAFSGCLRLPSASLPAATTLGIGTFLDCISLGAVELPKLTAVPAKAFYNTSSLPSIALPAGVTSIGCGA